ncbi:hypothetical protein CONCODRAFT_13370 [Conidiobolus coronatus NRRL 28638]|uniref:Uncharacterized protein n=1 Tax=Conidiobolus coronatus (strain ATCC 28846 / CBS 209.66 / NRRL 28638) TaxID=796925 RepID=A0A137NQY7_CONC2|nr:hypothetical protein CONCODRAFT_13370 [Conidiobolus coronatus NRRL 28638]|eukprot:KXN65145.1 hypothetical protein CONCODRAFT_13370 [Conidiobolus coronatus NRRL 28638]
MSLEFGEFIYDDAFSFAPLLIHYFGYKYINSRFENNNDKFNALILYFLFSYYLKDTFIDSLYFVIWYEGAIGALNIISCIISIRLVEKLGDRTISISRFILGSNLTSNALLYIPPNSLNSNLIKIAIGLIFSQITLLTFINLVIAHFAQSALPTFYDSLISITKFEFFNFDICVSILDIYIGVFIIPELLEADKIWTS